MTAHPSRYLARGWLSGLAGTAAMTLTVRAQRAVEQRSDGEADDPVDYDASHHVVDAAATVLRAVTGWTPTTRRQQTALFNAVHWGYGSMVGGAYPLLRRGRSRATSVAVFYAGCQTMAFTLFPLVGGTDWPWRWQRRLLVTSLAQHLIYALAVDAADRALDASGRGTA